MIYNYNYRISKFIEELAIIIFIILCNLIIIVRNIKIYKDRRHRRSNFAYSMRRITYLIFNIQIRL
jgi:hypothetical protein